jgi:CubicO group peptidase (beta-lactamase class C family)
MHSMVINKLKTVTVLFGALSAVTLGASLPLFKVLAADPTEEADANQPGQRETIIGSGKLVTKEFKVADFSSVEASHAFQVDITKGDSYSASITVDDNVVPFATVLKEDTALHIRLDAQNKSFQKVTLKAAVTMPSLTGIALSGASRATLKGFDSAKDFTVTLSGASQLAGDIKAANAKLTVIGAAKVNLTGSAQTGTLEASGASTLELKDFVLGNADAHLSGASRATLNVRDKLDYDLSGASHLTYRGNPTIGKKKLSGASRVQIISLSRTNGADGGDTVVGSRPLVTKDLNAADFSRIEQAIRTLMKDGFVPGLAIALVQNGEFVWQHGFGVMNAKTNEPVTDDTVFEAASLSKPVFAYLILLLVDSGKLDLDTPLKKYLPGNYDVPDDARIGQITARHVLSHQTGFPNWRSGALKIFYPPGERFSYSGEGYVYLSRVVEKITGEKFNDVVRKLVFEPLQMTSSSYQWEERYGTLKAFRHNALGDAAAAHLKLGANAASSLTTSARDYARFVAAILNGTGLKKETLKQMLTPQVQVREGGPNTLNRPTAKPFPNVAWGLGWGLQNTGDGPCFWHWGDNGNAKAFVLAYEQQKLGMVVFANCCNGLSIMPEIVEAAIGGQQPVLRSWLNYESYNSRSPGKLLLKSVVARGTETALSKYRKDRKGKTANELATETQIRELGYQLLWARRVQDAIEVFKLNAEEFPDSATVYESLGEAYAVNGEKELAIKNYERSVELDPNNTNAAAALKKLRENNKKGRVLIVA